MAGIARNNSALLITASATARANYTSPTFLNEAYRGCRVYVDITGKSSASHKPVFKLQGQIQGTTKWFSIWASTPASTAVQTIKALIFPGASTSVAATTGYNRVKNDFLPPVWRFTSTHAGTTAAGPLASWSAAIDFLE